MGASNFIDYDILEIISEFEMKAHDRHIELHLVGISKVNAGHTLMICPMRDTYQFTGDHQIVQLER